METASDKRKAKRGLCLLARGPGYEACLTMETLDLLVERGFATCSPHDGEWRLTPTGSAARLLFRRAT